MATLRATYEVLSPQGEPRGEAIFPVLGPGPDGALLVAIGDTGQVRPFGPTWTDERGFRFEALFVTAYAEPIPAQDGWLASFDTTAAPSIHVGIYPVLAWVPRVGSVGADGYDLGGEAIVLVPEGDGHYEPGPRMTDEVAGEPTYFRAESGMTEEVDLGSGSLSTAFVANALVIGGTGATYLASLGVQAAEMATELEQGDQVPPFAHLARHAARVADALLDAGAGGDAPDRDEREMAAEYEVELEQAHARTPSEAMGVLATRLAGAAAAMSRAHGEEPDGESAEFVAARTDVDPEVLGSPAQAARATLHGVVLLGLGIARLALGRE